MFAKGQQYTSRCNLALNNILLRFPESWAMDGWCEGVGKQEGELAIPKKSPDFLSNGIFFPPACCWCQSLTQISMIKMGVVYGSCHSDAGSIGREWKNRSVDPGDGDPLLSAFLSRWFLFLMMQMGFLIWADLKWAFGQQREVHILGSHPIHKQSYILLTFRSFLFEG